MKKGPGYKPVIRETADRYRYTSLAPYTPQKIASIIRAANSGDTEQLCLAAQDMLDRNWDVIGALSQRAEALCGAGFDVQPGDKSDLGRRIAEEFERELFDAGGRDLETFEELLHNLTDAVVMPFSAAQIIWRPGGSFAGFRTVESHHFTLRNGFVPQLVTSDAPDGMDLPPDGFIIHRFLKRPDPAHSGLARVLLYLHCFQNWPIKDLFSFIERFGMPFVVAKVDNNTFETEGDVLRALIRNFGPDGGGVFSRNTEVQLLNAANTGSDNVYFRALEFTHDAIYTLLVGQLASSGDSSGMSNGDAQTAVRQDILKSDARAVASTIRAQLAAPWTRFRFGGSAPVPRLHFKVEKAEDLSALAVMVNTLSQAGYKADATELSARFGLKLRYEPPAPAPGFAGMPGLSDASDRSDVSDTLNLKQKYDAMGVAIRAGLLTATPEIEAQTRAELGLPAMSPEVRKAWEATGGIRQPITLKSAEAEAVSDALDVDGKALSDKSDKSDKSDLSDLFAQKVYGKCAEDIAALTSITDPDEFRRKLDVLAADPGVDIDVFAAAVQRELMAGYLDGLKHSRIKRNYDE